VTCEGRVRGDEPLEPAKEDAVTKDVRGFGSMNRNKLREIASKGSKAAHAKGTAHEWSREEAREAGRKGGRSRRRTALDVPTKMPAVEPSSL